MAADLIPYGVQRIAHEVWDYAELRNKRQLTVSDVTLVIESLVTGQPTYYEADRERLSARDRPTMQAIANQGAAEIYSQAVREEFRLGAASTVQKALQSPDAKTFWICTWGITSSSTRCLLSGSSEKGFSNYACRRYSRQRNELTVSTRAISKLPAGAER